MKQITVILPATDDSGTILGPVTIKTISDIGLPGPPGPTGSTGPQGPGIASNIHRITVSADPPDNPDLNDLWVDIS